jgi:hypothetical protein
MSEDSSLTGGRDLFVTQDYFDHLQREADRPARPNPKMVELFRSAQRKSRAVDMNATTPPPGWVGCWPPGTMTPAAPAVGTVYYRGQPFRATVDLPPAIAAAIKAELLRGIALELVDEDPGAAPSL